MLRAGGVEVVAVASAVDALSAMLDPAAAFDAAVLDLTSGSTPRRCTAPLARAGVPVLLVSGARPRRLPSHATPSRVELPCKASRGRGPTRRPRPHPRDPEPEMSDTHPRHLLPYGSARARRRRPPYPDRCACRQAHLLAACRRARLPRPARQALDGERCVILAAVGRTPSPRHPRGALGRQRHHDGHQRGRAGARRHPG